MRDSLASRASALRTGRHATALGICTFLRQTSRLLFTRALLTRASLTLALLTHSRLAFALCPNCLGQQKAWDAKSGVLAIFLVVPLLVGYVSWRLIARWSRPSR